MKPIKILRLNRKHLSQMTYYFTSFQDNSCSHDGQSSICRIHSMQYIPVTPNMRDYNLLDSLGVAPDLERILDYAMLYGATYVDNLVNKSALILIPLLQRLLQVL